MKKLLLLLIFGILIVVSFGCKDDDGTTMGIDDDMPPIDTLPCLDALDSLTVPAINVDTMLQLDDCPLSWVEIYPERYRYLSPSFNPNNMEEVALIRLDNQTFEYRLCILNLCSGELDVLEAEAFNGVDWGTNGWILFSKLDLQVWKVRPDGSGQQRLTSIGENSSPIWNDEGDRIAYSLTNTGEFFILDEEGNAVDTVKGMENREACDWSATNKLITPFEPGSADDIYYFDLDLDTLIKIDEEGNEAYIHDGKWGKEERLYWLAQYQLAYTDINTKERTVLFKLADGFNNRFYRSFTISPDYKHIILNREDWKQLNECDVEVVHSLYIMDIDGSNERKVLIPE
ncbi:MAG: hypothetical protein AAFZ15_30520 [Bacteroidota bacterium]